MKHMHSNLNPLRVALVALWAATLVSCHHENPDDFVSTGAYVLNNGSWGDNNANIGIFDFASETLSADVFAKANGGMPLGDLGQDILAYGKDLFISVNGSQLVYVTDRDLKVRKTIEATANGGKLSPRSLCSGGGKVYVTYYEGFLGEIDPATYAVRIVEVGPNPEGVAYIDGKIYTANSGGLLPNYVYNDDLSVVDAATFKETARVKVNLNPNQLLAHGKELYVSSFGNYGAILPQIQCLDTASGQVRSLDYASPSAMALFGDALYILCGGYDENWNPLPGTVYQYDVVNGKDAGKFVTDGTILANAYSISATKGHVWVGCSDYKTTGDVYLFDAATGKLLNRFDTAGLNPQKVIE